MKVEIWFDVGKDWTTGIHMRGWIATPINERPMGAVASGLENSHHYKIEVNVDVEKEPTLELMATKLSEVQE